MITEEELSIDDIIAKETQKYKEKFEVQNKVELDNALGKIKKEYNTNKEKIKTMSSKELDEFISSVDKLPSSGKFTSIKPAIHESFEDHVAQAKKSMSTMDKYRMWHLQKKGLVDNTTTRVAKARMAIGAEVPEKISKKVVKEAKSSSTLSSITKGNSGAILSGAFSLATAIADFKEGRKEGKTVVESAGSAAFEFAKGEVLGMGGMLTLGGVKLLPKAAVSVYNEVQSINRSMNNLQRFTPFADSQFADTQQLATMRQSGMEMAKMANYNLQQTLMGTEARHLHR